jgi:hypothetical protein
MLLPLLLPRMEERDEAARLRVSPARFVPFGAVAATGKSQILQNRQTVLTEGNNVVDLEGLCGECRWAVTILTVPLSTFCDQSTEFARRAVRRHRRVLRTRIHA